MRSVRAWAAAGALLLAALAGRAINVPALAGNQKGDEATYILMAFSLAEDRNLTYERSDYARFAAMYGHGPDGIFLKRAYQWHWGGTTDVPATERLAFGKPLIYALAAAPFAALGGLGGLLVFNWVLLAACAWAAVRFCQARIPGWPGALLGLAFIGASDVFIFGAWMTPEVFHFALIFFAYFFWLYKRVATPDRIGRLAGGWTDLAAAVLIGAATYGKPPHALLIAPLLFDLLVSRQWRRLAGAVALFVICTGVLFGANVVTSGEWNYQGGGDRRSFSGRFPFDDQGTVFEAQTRGTATNAAGALDLAAMAVDLMPINLWYFIVGRHSGMLAYYLPGLVVAVAWLIRIRQTSLWQVTIAATFVGAVIAAMILTPDSWNGAGGPPGNRYIISTYPLLLFLLPAGTGAWAGVVALAGGVLFLGPMLLHPFAASSRTWLNVERAPLHWLPVELSLINDLPVRLEPRRGPIIFIDAPRVQFYYLDSNTFGVEGDGLWIAGPGETEIIIRTEYPIARLSLRLSSPIANEVTASIGGRTASAQVPEGGEATIQLSPASYFNYRTANNEGVYGDSCAYILQLKTTAGFNPRDRDPRSTDPRPNLGVFVRPVFGYR